MAPATNLDMALEMGLNAHEYDLILKQLGRIPTLTELGMYGVMWSEHCGYKYSKPVLAYFKKYKEALEAGGHENAGVIDFEGDLAVTFKIESHNHPSAVEPFQGAATGVGGILRDVFTMGARPIANLNSLRFGPLEPSDHTTAAQAERNRYLFDHVVKGIAHYGNCVGVPTVGGEVAFHWRFSGNPLVNAMAVGLVRKGEITTAAASGLGNPVIYLGSATGKDGIHGASFASQALDSESEKNRPNVQIGDPFAEKLLIEATLEALKTGAVAGIQDMGAAGLTCSTIEMSAKGRVGMEVDLDLVPIREDDMSAYEIMLSESQERMLCVAHSGREQEVISVFHKWGLHAVVIGHVIDEQVVRVRRFGQIEAELWPPHLADQCPIYSMEAVEPPYHAFAEAFDVSLLPEVDPKVALRLLLAHPNIASKRFVFQQFDQEVQTQTALKPGKGDAAVVAPRGSKKGLAISIDGNGLWTYLDPYAGGLLAVCEAARNVACTGAKPSGITDGLNFGNPQNPYVFWQFDGAVKGIAEAAEALGTPVVSGNVSFYNEAEVGNTKTEVLPTALVGMVGVIEDVSQRIGQGLPEEGLELALIGYAPDGISNEGLGGSLFLAVCHDHETGLPARPTLDKERAICEFLEIAVADGNLRAAHDVSDGGLAVCLAEMAIANQIGCEIRLEDVCLGGTSLRSKLFSETTGRVVVAYSPEKRRGLHDLALSKGIGFSAIGRSNRGNLIVKESGAVILDESLSELAVIFESAIDRLMT